MIIFTLSVRKGRKQKKLERFFRGTPWALTKRQVKRKRDIR